MGLPKGRLHYSATQKEDKLPYLSYHLSVKSGHGSMPDERELFDRVIGGLSSEVR